GDFHAAGLFKQHKCDGLDQLRPDLERQVYGLVEFVRNLVDSLLVPRIALARAGGLEVVDGGILQGERLRRSRLQLGPEHAAWGSVVAWGSSPQLPSSAAANHTITTPQAVRAQLAIRRDVTRRAAATTTANDNPITRFRLGTSRLERPAACIPGSSILPPGD